jgi:hypothetical protein
MKKIIFSLIILISFGAKSQVNTRLDTVFARNLVFTYEELSYMKGQWTPRDSAEKKFWKKMQAVVNGVPDKVNATNITVDSIPGPIAVLFYSNFRNANEGEVAGFTNNIKNKIKNYAPLTTTCQSIDNSLDAKRTNIVKNGKDDW